MEPFDYPDNDPGPQTLLTSLSRRAELDRLHWLMSRFQGYVGIANFMGARFTASEQALAPVLREAAQARADLCRRRLVAAQPRRPDRRRQQPAVRQGRGRARRGADAGRDRPRAGAARSAGARARHRGRHRRRRCRPRSTASRNGPRPPKRRGIVLVPISAVAIEAEVELTLRRSATLDLSARSSIVDAHVVIRAMTAMNEP